MTSFSNVVLRANYSPAMGESEPPPSPENPREERLSALYRRHRHRAFERSGCESRLKKLSSKRGELACIQAI